MERRLYPTLTCPSCGKLVSLTSYGRCVLCGFDVAPLPDESSEPAPPLPQASQKELEVATAHDQIEQGRDPATVERQLRLQGHDEAAVAAVVASGTKARARRVRRRMLWQALVSGLIVGALVAADLDAREHGRRLILAPREMILAGVAVGAFLAGIIRFIIGR